MLGAIGKVLKVIRHPVTAMVFRSFDEALEFVQTWIQAFADKKLTQVERRKIADKLNALAESLLGIDDDQR
jgi:hypothetical protein